MTVEILADACTDVIIMLLDENQSGYQDFSSFGGLPDSSNYGSSGTGDIKFTTTGAGAAGDAGVKLAILIKKTADDNKASAIKSSLTTFAFADPLPSPLLPNSSPSFELFL